jgi:hypothetical protein
MNKNNQSISSPIVMLIFNRPDTTAKVFAQVARIRPSKLIVIADGPRLDQPGEVERCVASRKIIEQVDWPCEVLTNYAESNMGCRHRVASGLTWVFKVVEEAIILEDDCVPDLSFFHFCDELLDRYRTDKRVMMISGDNFQQGVYRGDASYYFSRYCHVWGWATWQRAWKHYDVEMASWPSQRQNGWLATVLDNPGQVRRWSKTFDILHSGVVDTWDVQWMYACWRQQSLSIMPNNNLVANIGFRPDATHTKKQTDRFADLPVTSLSFPLKHPLEVKRDWEADLYTERHMFHIPWSEKVRRGIQKITNKLWE